MIYFESERLIFKDWEEKYLDDFRKMNIDEQVMEYFPKTLTHEETDSFYASIQDELKKYGYGLYAVETKDLHEFIGFIGFHWATINLEFAPCIEIGWRLKKEVWGKGYATEGAIKCLSHGFNNLGFRDVYSFTSKVNIKSENVMKKLGMKKVQEFSHPKIDTNSILCNHVLYHISLSQYSKLHDSTAEMLDDK